jgi:nitrogen fixation/metabolism regulation signal transduction histidine kinase
MKTLKTISPKTLLILLSLSIALTSCSSDDDSSDSDQSNYYLTAKVDGVNYIQETLPLYDKDKLIGVIALLEIEKTIIDYILQLLKSLIIVFILVLFIVIPFTILLIRTITDPIINLQQGIKEVSLGNLGKQLNIYSKDEIGQLTMSFNNMSKELAKTDKIKFLNKKLEKTSHKLMVAKQELEVLNESLENRVQSEIAKNEKHQHIMMEQTKRAQMGEMIENIAHQWRQPLAQINSAILLNYKYIVILDAEKSIKELAERLSKDNK